jgi:hypothetical protein
MNNDSVGRTPDEIEDEARHSYATGTVLLRAIADELNELTLKCEPISDWRLVRLHGQLGSIHELLANHTVWSMGDEPANDAEHAALAAYRGTYSDGRPVSIVVGSSSSGDWWARGSVFDCHIPWLPNTAGNDGYDGNGPTPPGCEVKVMRPPSRRRLRET